MPQNTCIIIIQALLCPPTPIYKPNLGIHFPDIVFSCYPNGQEIGLFWNSLILYKHRVSAVCKASLTVLFCCKCALVKHDIHLHGRSHWFPHHSAHMFVLHLIYGHYHWWLKKILLPFHLRHTSDPILAQLLTVFFCCSLWNPKRMINHRTILLMIIILYSLLSRKAYSTVFPHLEPPVLINESETPKLTCKPAASIHYPLLNGYFA